MWKSKRHRVIVEYIVLHDSVLYGSKRDVVACFKALIAIIRCVSWYWLATVNSGDSPPCRRPPPQEEQLRIVGWLRSSGSAVCLVTYARTSNPSRWTNRTMPRDKWTVLMQVQHCFASDVWTRCLDNVAHSCICNVEERAQPSEWINK